MTDFSAIRRIAAWLLTFCHRFSPPSVRDWGEAMLAELEFVEGDWPALAWAAGGATVLMRRSFIQFLTGRGEAALAGGPAPLEDSRGGSMRKLTLGLALMGSVVLAALLFAPSFRQALAVTMNSWARVVGQEPVSMAQLRRLEAQARAEQDANTLAFVALALPPGSESNQTAEEAVRLDSKLTWIYAVRAAQRWPDKEDPKAGEWIAKVEAWDPSNGYPRLLQAQRIALDDGLWLSARDPERYRSDEPWMGAMAEVFAATKWDSYFGARMDLDRDVMTRRHLNDPTLAVYAVSSHPFPNIWLLQRFALLTLDPGSYISPVNTAIPAKSAPVTSGELWKVARFGQVMSLQGQTFFERFEGAWLQREAYQRLAKTAEQSGNRDQQAMFAYQIESLDIRRHPLPDNGFLIEVYTWNAVAGQVAVAALLGSLILLLVWIAQPALAGVTKLKEGILAGGLRGVGVVGGAGLLASSVALYVSYHPYAELYARFLQAHGAAEADSLISFWGFAESAWMVGNLFSDGFGWLALLFLAVVLLVFEIYRVFFSHRPAHQAV
jgi:hypothetical protein